MKISSKMIICSIRLILENTQPVLKCVRMVTDKLLVLLLELRRCSYRGMKRDT